MLEVDDFTQLPPAWTWMSNRPGADQVAFAYCLFNKNHVLIGADNYEIGRAAGLFINSLLKKKKTMIVEVWGREGSSSADVYKRQHIPNLRLLRL